ncbi:hypothetical protein [Abyssogena phaseoliformis symbiont]|uniref:hypothetical protein n=1 Tax=Abyssogena phaseoliformis symbiont TaxID=596095 RepID=UPI001915556D|nr:hypothetical protein [Abyssogena phaseoliformis symbiont]
MNHLPSAGEHFSYWNNGTSYFFSADGKSIEACNWVDDENEETTNDYLTCQDEKRNLGEFTSYQLSSGESVWVYPALDYDNKITTEYKLVFKSDGSTYNVNTDVSISAVDAEIETYSPFNWSAYKKIFTEFAK